MTPENKISLGKTGIEISPLGIGIMQWRDMKPGISDRNVNQDAMKIYEAALEGGINFFDTAESYGNGISEIQLGKCLQETPANIIVATKFMPYPWRISKAELRISLKQSLKRLGLARIDLYQMHWPIPPVTIAAWMDAMADAVAEGLIRAVGVSNYFPSQTRRAYDALAKHGIPLASTQLRYSLLHRQVERNGLLELCKELGITLIAYAPLEKGILTGKYSPQNVPGGFRGRIYNRNYLDKIAPLLGALHQISEAHPGVTMGQAALNWLICKGAVPIPGARSQNQAKENAGAMGWRLTPEEIARLEQISDQVTG